MHIIFSILLFGLFSFAALSEQGTMTPDDSEARQSEASMSGTSDEELDVREEEVQLIEKEEYDPTIDSDPIEIDREKMDQYEQEVEESTP